MNAGRHHQQVDDEAEHPHQLARRLVRSVVEAAENVDVGDQEEEAGAVHVRVAQQPAGVDVAHDQLVDRIERAVGGRMKCIASTMPVMIWIVRKIPARTPKFQK